MYTIRQTRPDALTVGKPAYGKLVVGGPATSQG